MWRPAALRARAGEKEATRGDRPAVKTGERQGRGAKRGRGTAQPVNASILQALGNTCTTGSLGPTPITHGNLCKAKVALHNYVSTGLGAND